MRQSRTPYLIGLVIGLSWSMLPLQLCAQQRMNPSPGEQALTFSNNGQRSSATYVSGEPHALMKVTGGGIKEEISAKYKARYQEWKSEFLSTETGRSQWETFEQNERFTLTITISSSDRHGAGTGKYKWNDAGELVAATITLGSQIDEGYPNPIYYPVMSALAHSDPSILNSNILAAAKIAHEFGHVKQAAAMDGALYRLQNQLIPAYNKILLSNKRNTFDPQLIELAKQMKGTPVEIWEDREYWGEANAMLYLRDRITNRGEQRALFTRIIKTVELYAKNYLTRFDQLAR